MKWMQIFFMFKILPKQSFFILDTDMNHPPGIFIFES